ncbi:MAG: hypothetical protein SNJ67_00350 [Chloracidobacterium sp.]
MNPQVYAAKQHLYKYRQALLQAIREVTGRPLEAPSLFEPTRSYADSWHEVGTLALLVWQMSALDSDRFDANPRWEATANETIRFLSEHCAGCGKQLTRPTIQICQACLTGLDAPTRHALQASEVTRQIQAYLVEHMGTVLADADADDANLDDA